MPVIHQLFKLCINCAFFLILLHYSLGCLRVLLTQNIDKLCALAVSKLYIRLQCTAAVAVKVKAVVTISSFHCNRVAVISVRTDERIKAAVIMAYLLSGKSEKSLLSVEASVVPVIKFVDMLNYHISLKRGPCYKQGVLEIDLILFIVVFISELDKTESRQLPCSARVVGHLCSPHLIGLIERNIVGDLGADTGIVRLNGGVSCSVVTLGLIIVKALAHRLPCA